MPIKVESERTAKIVEWSYEKGYGFLQVGSGRVFLHRRDFAERHKRPAVGDLIRFTVGVDARGRTCAKEAVHVNDGGRLTVVTALMLLGLLVLPALAVWRSGMDWRWACGYALVISVTSYGRYSEDKRRARVNQQRQSEAAGGCSLGERRVSEAALHFTEFLGGWPGAFLAQRRLRHKVSKRRYQVVFWAIVLAWQFAAFDSLQQWKYSRAAWETLGRIAMRRSWLQEGRA